MRHSGFPLLEAFQARRMGTALSPQRAPWSGTYMERRRPNSVTDRRCLAQKVYPRTYWSSFWTCRTNACVNATVTVVKVTLGSFPQHLPMITQLLPATFQTPTVLFLDPLLPAWIALHISSSTERGELPSSTRDMDPLRSNRASISRKCYYHTLTTLRSQTARVPAGKSDKCLSLRTPECSALMVGICDEAVNASISTT